MEILIIEDNESDFVLLDRLSRKIDGSRIEWCTTLQKGMDYLATDAVTVDVILLDLSLPDSFGLDTLTQLRSRFPSLPIIILSGNDDDDFALEAVRHGAQDYLVKGEITGEILRRALRYAIERKQAQEELATERNLLRTLIDSLPDYIFIKDVQERYIMTNIAHAQAVKKTSTELLGKTAFDVFPEEFAKHYQEDDLAILESGKPVFNIERQTVDDKGNIKTVLTTKVPIRDHTGQVAGLVGISRDITERKLLEARTVELLAERERIEFLERFIRDMSHDVRTPLTIIQSSLHLLQRNQNPEKSEGFYDKINQQLIRLEELITASLELTHLMQPNLSLKLETVDLVPMIKSLVEEYQPFVESKNLSITFEEEIDQCTVEIDVVEFARAMLHILHNAVTYTPEGGHITVGTTNRDDHLLVSIQDTGVGIPPLDLPHVFTPFFRADKSRSSKTGGHGLGLSIAYQVITALNGTIEVESKVNQGSTFLIKLPTRN